MKPTERIRKPLPNGWFLELNHKGKKARYGICRPDGTWAATLPYEDGEPFAAAMVRDIPTQSDEDCARDLWSTLEGPTEMLKINGVWRGEFLEEAKHIIARHRGRDTTALPQALDLLRHIEADYRGLAKVAVGQLPKTAQEAIETADYIKAFLEGPTPQGAAPHEWHERFNLTCCKRCGIVKRADDKNSPCKGPSTLSLRGAPAQPSKSAEAMSAKEWPDEVKPGIMWLMERISSDDRSIYGGRADEERVLIKYINNLRAQVRALDAAAPQVDLAEVRETLEKCEQYVAFAAWSNEQDSVKSGEPARQCQKSIQRILAKLPQGKPGKDV